MQPSSLPPRENPPLAEFTVKAVLLGCLLGLLMTAANTYLGLYAGMCVSASIPAAVISMGILRGILRTGTILENNIVQTIASAGESLAAGIIFTIPALVITGVWDEFHFWPVSLIAMLGGILGVLFMVPLRRTLVVEEKELKYPEGVACAEVLEVGQSGGSGIFYVFGALLFGAAFKAAITGVGLMLGTLHFAFRAGRTAFYVGCDVSAALVAVGYIVGFNVALLIFLGGLIGWGLGIPVYYLVVGFPADAESIVKTMHDTWSEQIRYMGVGAMVVGGIWSIVGVRRGIAKGIRSAVAGFRNAKDDVAPDRTDTDLGMRSLLAMLVPTVVLVFALYIVLTGSLVIGLVSGLTMLVAAFFFVAVSSYIVGLVGASNNPVSGMTISTVLLASLMLLVFGLSGEEGILAALGVAGVVCCAACTAGDVSQDLKTGHLVGATPYKQQWAQVIGVLVPAMIIAPILTVLHASYGIGMQVHEGVEYLKAPQANLFANITQAMFGTGKPMPWNMVALGAVLGVALILLDECLRRAGSQFRAYVMPVAVGVYLPWSLGVPIFLGGLAALATEKIVGRSRAKRAVHRGVLVGSGLIAGEALMGIVLALVLFFSDAKETPLLLPFPETTSETTVTMTMTLLSLAGLATVVGGTMLAAVLAGRETEES